MSARRALVIAAHLALWAASLLLAFNLRFDFRIPLPHGQLLPIWLPVLLAVRTLTYFQLGLFRGLWRYTGARDLATIVIANTVSTALTTVLILYAFKAYPRSVIAIEWLTATMLVGGARFSIRMLRHWVAPVMASPSEARRQRILILGAGDAGEMLLREVLRSHGGRWEPVAFLDDDPLKRGVQIHGVRVVGPIAELESVAAELEIDEVLIAIPSATGAEMRGIVEHCKRASVRFKTIPGLDHLIDGRVAVSQLRNVAIEDLLGREPVQLDMDAISAVMQGHVVMVSGAGGSIGSELCRQVCRFDPAVLLLVERTENALFNVHRELAARYPDVPLVPCIADVADEPRMAELFAQHRPTLVLHAAAHKHVPMMEWNPGEAVKNNVFGTKTLADLADRFGVERFVMISTDKAVNPTSVMGVSKRVAEIYVQALSQRSRTKFVTVRFGNVLGSAGSVIPIFQEQIANGGPVTVTHPEMRRYFMTIPEASQLVLQAGTMGNGGEIFILDMGEPVRIADLARDLITLSGFTPDVDIEIRFSGVRPGEKLFEELSVDAENAEKTRHPKIFVGRFRPHPWEQVKRHLDELGKVAEGRPADIRRKFADAVPEYRPQHVPTPQAPAAAAKKLSA
ncbi:polysaccharide biosynthesis protein [Anaeromyxobacter oryzae]|uniref:polysaccharide biosynthesis protein n=1 Tax=Anaeromyxobacter oryzae TaxID=2918170 RepID=UPI0020C0BB4E|nr:nucleoside-diphosphate sugar epimerase/dehydratase [Anaeromyxobacter oryzae]